MPKNTSFSATFNKHNASHNSRMYKYFMRKNYTAMSYYHADHLLRMAKRAVSTIATERQPLNFHG